MGQGGPGPALGRLLQTLPGVAIVAVAALLGQGALQAGGQDVIVAEAQFLASQHQHAVAPAGAGEQVVVVGQEHHTHPGLGRQASDVVGRGPAIAGRGVHMDQGR